MGSCVSSRQDKRDTKGKRLSVYSSGSPKSTHAQVEDHKPSIEEAIDSNEEIKEKLEGEISGLEKNLKETK